MVHVYMSCSLSVTEDNSFYLPSILGFLAKGAQGDGTLIKLLFYSNPFLLHLESEL